MFLLVGIAGTGKRKQPVCASAGGEEFVSIEQRGVCLDRDQLFGTAFVAWLMIAPLAFYVLAWLAQIVLRAFGLRSDGYGARLALFWSLLAATPLALLLGFVQGLNGPGAGASLAFALWIGAFLVFWVQTTREAIRPRVTA